ncbi:GPW/gp25 family protein [Vreelandella glaciei]|nr:GPW/gp25 family protein [Halomonas glaciei]
MNINTGEQLEGAEHIRQSIADIITTPIGSRVMRREYGSLVPELLDMPMTDALLMQVYAATVIAVSRWEPRITITGTRRTISTDAHGTAIMELIGKTQDGQMITSPITNAIAAAIKNGNPQNARIKRLIENLFKNSKKGVFYIVNPVVLGTANMFKDAAGNLPVTKNGDPVGRINDLSGNNNHLIQPVSANRPIYRTEAGQHWIEYDGVSSFMTLTRNPEYTSPFDIAISAQWGGAGYGAFRSRTASGAFAGRHHPEIESSAITGGGSIRVNREAFSGNTITLNRQVSSLPATGVALNCAPFEGDITPFIHANIPSSGRMWGYLEVEGGFGNLLTDVERFISNLHGGDPLEKVIQNAFAGSNQGLLLVPKPIVLNQQNLWQDTLIQTPVTATGDPVGRLRSVIPGSQSAVQPVAAARPPYQADNGLQWLLPDGINDHLDIPVVSEIGSFTIVIALSATDTGSNQRLFGNRGTGEAGTVPGFFIRPDYVYLDDGQGGVVAFSIPYPEGPRIMSIEYDASAGSVRVFINRALQQENSVPAGFGSVQSSGFIRLFSAPNNGNQPFSGKFYGLAMAYRVMSESERELTETYAAQLAGVAL